MKIENMIGAAEKIYSASEEKYLDFDPNSQYGKERTGQINFTQKVVGLLEKDKEYSLREIEDVINKERGAQQKAPLGAEVLDHKVNFISVSGKNLATQIRDVFSVVLEYESEVTTGLNRVVEKMEDFKNSSTGFRAAAILLPFSYPQKDEPSMTYEISWSKLTPEAVEELLKI